MRISGLIKPEILELIEKKDWNQLKNVLSYWPAPDIADFLMDVEMPVRVFLFVHSQGRFLPTYSPILSRRIRMSLPRR